MATVKVGKRIYQMKEQEARKLLKVAASYVPCGIYATQIGDYYELRNDPMTKTQIKQIRREYRKRGIKVYATGL